MIHEPDACWRATEHRDARFDGRFIVAVRSTRIYCRPSCPATTPKRTNVIFYATAAAAQYAGYRACKRCRPDASPGSPEWNLRADAVARAMRLIADGVVDREGVRGLARRLGYSERHLTRLLTTELGAGPLAIARAQRAQTARTLLESTDLSITGVAFAAGFASVRQFNDTMREVFASTPTDLRRAGHRRERPQPGRLTVRLPFRAPLATDALFDFLGARAVPGIESVDDSRYARTLNLPHGSGVAVVEPRDDHLSVTFSLDDVTDLASAVRRLRDLFDLDADPIASDEALARDPKLRRLIRATPGLRVPGVADATELVVRAIVGQQISVAGARTLVARLVDELGSPIETGVDGVDRTFPTASAIAESELTMLGMPQARRDTIRRSCAAIADGSLDLAPGVDRDEARAGLLAIRGIGTWTTEYVAMRALRDTDAFLPTDLGVRHGADAIGIGADPASIAEHSRRWQPWRAYALMHLWHAPRRGAQNVTTKEPR